MTARTARQRDCCENCRYWLPDSEVLGGICRRRAPVATADGSTIQPVTDPDQWCGEYRPDTDPWTHT